MCDGYFNIVRPYTAVVGEGASLSCNQYTQVSRTIDVIRAAAADVVGPCGITCSVRLVIKRVPCVV